MTNFVSLHNQTSYSLLDSLIDVKELFIRAKELGQKAIAITDHGSIAAAWDGLKASSETGVKLIIGCECYFSEPGDERMRHIILLAKNAIGYKNLLTLNKKGFDRGTYTGKRVYSVINWELLEQHKEGLICLTACGAGIISQLLMTHKPQEAETTLLRLKEMFGDNLGIEVQSNSMKRGSNAYHDEIDQAFLNRQLIGLGKKHGIRVVATCNTHYLHKEESDTHNVLLAIGAHQPVYSNYRIRYPSPEFYLKSGEEVKSFFLRSYGEEQAQQFCDNSIYFADLCEQPDWIDPKFSNPSGKELPIFPVKDEKDYQQFKQWSSQQIESIQQLEEDKQFLRYKCDKLFASRLPNLTTEQITQYQERIIEELDVLEFHGFSSYMLIVADFIDWARQNDIAVGPGRGSVGGSLIAYLLGIHQADPIAYNLIFARFHNKAKQNFPDIDSDLAPSGREKVKNYLRQKYGDDHVASVSNVNTITPKVYVRDISRSCELGGSRDEATKLGNDIADCIPADLHSIAEALRKVPLFGEYVKKYPEFEKYQAICGKQRNMSTHAGGILISARPMTGLVPLRRDKDSTLAIEYDKDKSEENGLVKMDILGLSSLDLITQTMQLIKLAGKKLPAEPFDYNAYDQKTYDLISGGDTFCVFQLGTSGGTIDLCKRIKPKNINDLANINALARPSARDMRNDFIKTRNGDKPVSLLHPKLNRAFGGTYGFGLYEECLMYLAQDIAGWSLHSADRLRKLTKEKGKNPKKVATWRAEFISDSVKNGVNEIIATRIWDEVVENFQGYGFNCSHSVLYSMISFHTAYLKAHYPIEFLMANLMAEVKSNTPDARSNIGKIKKELKRHRVKIIAPNLNQSQLTYTIKDGHKLITGLDAIKYVSDVAIKDIIDKRPFKNFFDFMARVSSKTVRANSIQALTACGALDEFGLKRKSIFLYCSDYRKKLQIWLKKHDPNTEIFVYPFPDEQEWSQSELYALEQFYLGESFVCPAYQAYDEFFKNDHTTIAEIRRSKDKTKFSSIKGVVRDFFEFRVKKESSKYYGMPMLKCVIQDKNGEECALTIFPDRWEQMKARMSEINRKAEMEVQLALHFSGSTNNYEDSIGIIFDKLFNLSLPPAKPAELKAQKINLKLAKKKDQDSPILTPQQMLDQIEDNLIDEGLVDYDDNDDLS